jgi:polysaccharide pyruvyl transferase WcaK-like protein
MSRWSKLISAGRQLVSRTPPEHTAYYLGWVGHRNLGDEALLMAIRQAFHPLALDHKFDQGRRRLNNDNTNHALAIIGGGTLVGEINSIRRLQPLLNRRATCVVFGTGVEDPAFWSARNPQRYDLAAWKQALEQCGYIGVRGPLSQSHLQQIDVPSEVLGDPACMFVQNDFRSCPQERHLGLNIGTGASGMFGSDESVFAVLAQTAKKLLSDRWKITLYVVWPDDLPIAHALAKEIGLGPGCIRRFYRQPEKFMAAVGRHPVFIGFKLHSVVLAYCAGVPSFMIEYRPKCRDFMQSINVEEFVTRADQLSADHLLDKVAALQQCRSEFIEQTAARLRKYRAKQIATAQRLVAEVREKKLTNAA